MFRLQFTIMSKSYTPGKSLGIGLSWARCEGKQNKKQKLYADDSGSRVDLNLGIYEILYWIKGHVADSHQPPPIFPASSTTRFESFDEF